MSVSTIAPPEIESLPLVYRGKVRDLYAVDDRHLLMVASDRLSAFDVILPTVNSRQGRGADSGFQFLVCPHPPHHSEPSATRREDVGAGAT